MGAQENKRTAQAAYAAFGKGDADGAMANIDSSIAWTTRGHNALSGTAHGKEELGALWGKYMAEGLRSAPHDFIADGDKVVVLTEVSVGGETVETADVMTYNADGKLVAFNTVGDEKVMDRVFAG